MNNEILSEKVIKELIKTPPEKWTKNMHVTFITYLKLKERNDRARNSK